MFLEEVQKMSYSTFTLTVINGRNGRLYGANLKALRVCVLRSLIVSMFFIEVLMMSFITDIGMVYNGLERKV